MNASISFVMDLLTYYNAFYNMLFKSNRKRRLDAASSTATGLAIQLDQWRARGCACQAAVLMRLNGMSLNGMRTTIWTVERFLPCYDVITAEL
ncbi:hypothetical protein [Dictyobacter kobayashii]|uniref:hypothetical protein n=1 Tax=Dictyobacter kobayashii TaxID=2014872 RepID=UPI000F83ABA9|nr:hypothetical protein [Dictyobacter kobayashii]